MHIFNMTIPQWVWRSGDPQVDDLFYQWIADFIRSNKREPSIPEMLAWAYRQGVKDGEKGHDVNQT